LRAALNNIERGEISAALAEPCALRQRAGDNPIARVALTVACIIVSVFVLSYAWEFYLERVAMRVLGRPYDAVFEAADNWRFIWTSPGFALLSLVIPAGMMMRNDRRLRRTVRRLLEAQNAARSAKDAQSRFIATMSHELRTPLNAIIGFSEMTELQLFGPVDDRYRAYARDIHSSGVHLLTIVNDILDLTKSESHNIRLDMKAVPPGATVQAVGRMVVPLCEAGQIAYTEIVPIDLPAIRVDEVRFRQVLINLVSNAVKFTPAGGSVSVTVRHERDAIVILVADTGIGIAAANLPEVVKPFFQVDSRLSRKHDGTGLGLPIAIRLLEMMGGRFTLESEFGVGTRATVRLPAIYDVAALAA